MVFNKLNDEAIIPHYQTISSVGLDLHTIEAAVLKPGERKLFGTGLTISLPEGYEGQIRSRSGLAYKFGVAVLNSPGTIDPDYTGELKVLLINHGDSSFNVEKGDRIAQLVVAPVYQLVGFTLENVREEGGFGSTG